MQALATIIFFIVFIELFIALSLYIGITIYRLFRPVKKTGKKEEV